MNTEPTQEKWEYSENDGCLRCFINGKETYCLMPRLISQSDVPSNIFFLEDVNKTDFIHAYVQALKSNGIREMQIKLY